MSKTEKSKNKLTEALRALPGDFSLSTARQHMINALKSIQKFEAREADHKKSDLDLHQQWWGEIEGGVVKSTTSSTQETIAQALNYLDSMINAEKKNLSMLEQQRIKQPPAPPSSEMFLS